MSAGVSAVLETAKAMRWSAPELTVVLAEHAARTAAAAGDDDTALRAWGWALNGRIALGEGASAAVRAVDAVGGPTGLGDSPAGARLRLGVAAVARMVGDLAVAHELLAQILEVAAEPSPLRADALIEAAWCVASDPHAPLDQLAERTSAAGKACVAMGQETELIGGVVLLGISSEADRRRGRLGHGLVFARAGLDRVRSGLTAPSMAADLSLALVASLLDEGKADAAAEVGDEVSAGQAEVGAIASLGWLRLLLVRHQRAAGVGDQDAALESLDAVLRSLGGRELPELESACHTAISELHEHRGDFSAALAASRAAHAASTRHRCAVEAVRVMLARLTKSAPPTAVANAGPAHRLEHPDTQPCPPAPPAQQHREPANASSNGHVHGSDPPAAVAADDFSTNGQLMDGVVVDGDFPEPPRRPLASAVVVDTAFVAPTASPDQARELLVRLGARMCGALPAGGRLHPLDDGALAVVLAGHDPATAQSWADSLRAELTEHWSELVGELPAAQFRLTLGHQASGRSVEALISELHAPAPAPGVLPQPLPTFDLPDDSWHQSGVTDEAVGDAASSLSLRDQWAAAGALGQRARASVLVAERPEDQLAAPGAPEPRIGELSFAELLAGALDAYREE